MNRFVFFLLLPFFLLARESNDHYESYVEEEPIKSPQEIQEELDTAEKQFNEALNIFNPWYTGPLITPGASMMPVGVGNMQPYIFFKDYHATYDSNRNSVSLPNKQLQLQFASNIQTGITDNFDLNLSYQAFMNWQGGETGGGYGDMSLVGGFRVLKQTPYIPEVKVTITQNFPTGKFKNLSLNGLGLNATGSGAYSTQVAFIISKVVLWNTRHPMNMRLFMGYEVSPAVHVKNFNAYGGGRGTRGRVYPGDVFSIDFGYEYSLTQRWVLATDIVYSTQGSTPFYGTAGFNRDGTTASVGAPSNDNLSFSPAIEYNFNPNVGLIAGVWFSAYGRNSFNFLSGIISITISFP